VPLGLTLLGLILPNPSGRLFAFQLAKMNIHRLPRRLVLSSVMLALSLRGHASQADDNNSNVHTAGAQTAATEIARPWPVVTLALASQVTLSAMPGDSLNRGVARLAKPPYTVPWLRADVSFEINRIFTNYSGDVSGRFLELASLTTPPGQTSPPALSEMLKTVVRYQKPDGHFGAEVDLAKPLKQGSAPITMLWGNARLLVGLVTAAQRFGDKDLLAAARRLGDYYVNTADSLCNPAREAEFCSSGTSGEGYSCCYFPAIEGLAMLFRATQDNRYLAQAERMAEFLTRFDRLPVDHSHGNLCAWRGILELYAITGKRTYLDRAQAKWEAAMQGGFVWPLGGVGEHWHISFMGDEGCSQSDWLRFNLDLWRFTGQTRYLDVAQRLLENQYAMNQCPNGGYGMTRLDNEPGGPIAAIEKTEEWPFCCSFHGPLGLYFLKGYLAAGSERGVIVNFPYDFVAPVKAAGREWAVAVRSQPDYVGGRTRMVIELSPRDKSSVARRLWVRMPAWASSTNVAVGTAAAAPAVAEEGYLRIEHNFKAGDKVTVEFQNTLLLEGRRFHKEQVAAGQVARLKDVAILAGPDLLFATPVKFGGRPTVLATCDSHGRLSFPTSDDGQFVTVALPGIGATGKEIDQAIESARPIFLKTWPAIVASRTGPPPYSSAMVMSDLGRGANLKARRFPFMFDVVVVPGGSLAAGFAKLTARARQANEEVAPIFGENLEKRPEIWPRNAGWTFTRRGLLVTANGIGLIDAGGYGDYRFEFEMTLPREGQGITGWVVRAADEDNCLMFQLQTADSTFNAAEFKTRPNTLRPHRCVGGQWEIAEPVALPKAIHKGEPHRIAVECREGKIDVFLDGQQIYTRAGLDLRGGAVGFRATGQSEQGLFREIGLKKL
jgi:DUF1680 family protein